MKKLVGLIVGGVMAASCLFGAASASAATEFGDNCVANRAASENDISLFSIQSPRSPFPSAAPFSGVITKWKLNLTTEAEPSVSIPEDFKVFRANRANGTVQVVAESRLSVVAGSNTFDTRIPVQAGDFIGLSGAGPLGVLYCEEPKVSTVIGAFEGSASIGSTVPFAELTEEEIRVPAVAVIEPDADGDGYGDETQDQCPQSATTQAPCPTAVLNASANAKGAFVTVLVTSNIQASVTVAGKAKLGKGKTAKANGGTQVVAPGALAKFTIPITGKLKSALKKLSRKQKLALKLTATAPNLVGNPTVKKLTVKLKGQAKPAKKS